MIYLDHNATTQPCAEALQEMCDALERAWANPSSTHEPGQMARRLLADARARVASFLGCQGAELVFTSGATEANHQAVRGALALGRSPGRAHWLLSALEHPGLQALADQLAAEGVPVRRLPALPDGRVDLAAARALIAEAGNGLALVSLMGANNETGVVQPVAEVAALAHGVGALMHVDATQLVGKSLVPFSATGADLFTASAHKLHGPKGIGALVVKKGLALPALLAGRQERHRRGGTENLPGIAGFAAACERAARTLPDDLARMTALREQLEEGLAALPGLVVIGRGAPRLPNTLCVRFAALDAEPVLSKLERAGVVASSGAACTASGTLPSHVLLALGASAAEAKAGVRFSLGRDTTAADIAHTVAAAHRVIAPLLAEAAAGEALA